MLLVSVALFLYPREEILKYQKQSDAVSLLAAASIGIESRAPENTFQNRVVQLFIPADQFSNVFAVKAGQRNGGEF